MTINRKVLVGRHHPVMTKFETLSPLSIGNGEFAFTADITGLQTFPEAYEVPLGTQAHWGWHSTGGYDQYDLNNVALHQLDSHGRNVGYPLHPENKEEAYHWLRQNPHRLQLGQIGFRLLKEDGTCATIGELHNVHQELNLWEGMLYSEFQLEGTMVSVTTVCDPIADEIGVNVVSSLVSQGRLQVIIHFPSPNMTSRTWEQSTELNWEEEHHTTVCTEYGDHGASFTRSMDDDQYYVRMSWSGGRMDEDGLHKWQLTASGNEDEFTLSVSFSPTNPVCKSFEDKRSASREHWENFWMSGAMVELVDSKDPRARELERRVVLSQYLCALHSAGSLPPQETGLLYNSWFGKFHLEMHWWHAAHFPLWGRSQLMERSLDWYLDMLPYAKELAASQGYEGARWPKMVGHDGKQSPSPIAPALIWQQPHPIAMVELLYRANPNKELLYRWAEMVFETANFMVSFAAWDESRQAHVLGPPLIPAQENHHPADATNPPYELEYWNYGLRTAEEWAKRLEVPANPKWNEVANALAELPQAEGVYLAHENCPDTFTVYHHDHPSMVGAYGILPGTLVQPQTMHNTLQRIRQEWQWDTAWGWDFPMCAMTAVRLGDNKMAIEFLLMDQIKNSYLPNGHNYQHPKLTAYLPGNGGLLTAISMMACGWDGAPNVHAPGFPQDGSWTVKWEGLQPYI